MFLFLYLFLNPLYTVSEKNGFGEIEGLALNVAKKKRKKKTD